jgi:lysophospholipase L1-like esterase
MSRPTPALLALAVAISACGGGGGGTTPTPVVPTHPVVATVFYDENGNGVLDSGENARVPDVEVEVGGRAGRSEKVTGRATVAGVPEGTHRVSARAASLPPFYRPVESAMVTVQSPQPAGADAFVPLTLSIGQNRPNVYMGFGDSITVGDGARSTDGYRDVLQDLLQRHFGRGQVVNQGLSGGRTPAATERIGASLNRERPAYTLILYGTNDWNQNDCKVNFPCFTVDNLRHIIGAVKSVQSLPVLATIPPANPANAFSEERNDWVRRMNDLLRPMARAEGAVLADVHAAFLREPDLSALFADHVHPNDRGYQVLAGEFFRALTRPPTSTAAALLAPPHRW